MILDRVGPGDSVPDNVNVIIEIPTHGEPVKYEVDKSTGAMFVDRFLATAMRYPCNYGYIPETLSADGDPVDVLVLTPRPLISGSVISCRPVGVLEMEDEAGDDAKLLAVPVDRLTGLYRNIASFRDVIYDPPRFARTIVDPEGTGCCHISDLLTGISMPLALMEFAPACPYQSVDLYTAHRKVFHESGLDVTQVLTPAICLFCHHDQLLSSNPGG